MRRARQTITWAPAIGGGRFATVNGHKIVDLSHSVTGELYLVQPLGDDGLPAGDVADHPTFATLADACAASGRHLCPCGTLLAPGCVPDPDAPASCPA